MQCEADFRKRFEIGASSETRVKPSDSFCRAPYGCTAEKRKWIYGGVGNYAQAPKFTNQEKEGSSRALPENADPRALAWQMAASQKVQQRFALRGLGQFQQQ